MDIFYPEGYEIGEVNPDPDDILENDRVLIWIGPKKFAAKTPAIKMVVEADSFFSNLQTYSLLIGLLVLGASLLIVFYRLRIANKRKEKSKHVPSAIFEIESNVDKIIKILQESGGYSHQSTLAEKLGLSKSKVSETLSDMEKKGLIKRQKRGREKIVILLKQENGKKYNLVLEISHVNLKFLAKFS